MEKRRREERGKGRRGEDGRRWEGEKIGKKGEMAERKKRRRVEHASACCIAVTSTHGNPSGKNKKRWSGRPKGKRGPTHCVNVGVQRVLKNPVAFG
jgi:hypothetical protein